MWREIVRCNAATTTIQDVGTAQMVDCELHLGCRFRDNEGKTVSGSKLRVTGTTRSDLLQIFRFCIELRLDRPETDAAGRLLVGKGDKPILCKPTQVTSGGGGCRKLALLELDLAQVLDF